MQLRDSLPPLSPKHILQDAEINNSQADDKLL